MTEICHSRFFLMQTPALSFCRHIFHPKVLWGWVWCRLTQQMPGTCIVSRFYILEMGTEFFGAGKSHAYTDCFRLPLIRNTLATYKTVKQKGSHVTTDGL